MGDITNQRDRHEKQSEFWDSIVENYEDRRLILERESKKLRERVSKFEAIMPAIMGSMGGNVLDMLPREISDPRMCKLPAKLPNIDNISMFSMDSIDLEQMDKIKLMAGKERQLLEEVNKLRDKEYAFEQTLEGMNGPPNAQSNGQSGCANYGELQRTNKRLMDDNRKLFDEVEDLKLTLKQNQETVQGPMARELDRERRKVKQLEDELARVVCCEGDKQDEIDKKINSLVAQLEACGENLKGTRLLNQGLKDEIDILNHRINELQTDLINQKVGEVHLLSLLKADLDKCNESRGDGNTRPGSSGGGPPSSEARPPTNEDRPPTSEGGTKPPSDDSTRPPTSEDVRKPQPDAEVTIIIGEADKLSNGGNSLCKMARELSKSLLATSGDVPDNLKETVEGIKGLCDMLCAGNKDIEKPKKAGNKDIEEPIKTVNKDIEEPIMKETAPALIHAQPPDAGDRTDDAIGDVATKGTNAAQSVEYIPSEKIVSVHTEKEIPADISTAATKTQTIDSNDKLLHLKQSLQGPGKSLVKTTADDIPAKKSDTDVEKLEVITELEVQGNVGVDTEVIIVKKSIDGFNVTTTMTKSGMLEVITEGPAGVIETTMMVSSSGNIEIITEFTETIPGSGNKTPIDDASALSQNASTNKCFDKITMQCSPAGACNTQPAEFDDVAETTQPITKKCRDPITMQCAKTGACNTQSAELNDLPEIIKPTTMKCRDPITMECAKTGPCSSEDDEEVSDEEDNDDEVIDVDATDEEINDEEVNDKEINDEAVNGEEVNDIIVIDEEINDEAVNGEEVNDIIVIDEEVNGEEVNNEKVNDEGQPNDKPSKITCFDAKTKKCAGSGACTTQTADCNDVIRKNKSGSVTFNAGNLDELLDEHCDTPISENEQTEESIQETVSLDTMAIVEGRESERQCDYDCGSRFATKFIPQQEHICQYIIDNESPFEIVEPVIRPLNGSVSSFGLESSILNMDRNKRNSLEIIEAVVPTLNESISNIGQEYRDNLEVHSARSDKVNQTNRTVSADEMIENAFFYKTQKSQEIIESAIKSYQSTNTLRGTAGQSKNVSQNVSMAHNIATSQEIIESAIKPHQSTNTKSAIKSDDDQPQICSVERNISKSQEIIESAMKPHQSTNIILQGITAQNKPVSQNVSVAQSQEIIESAMKSDDDQSHICSVERNISKSQEIIETAIKSQEVARQTEQVGISLEHNILKPRQIIERLIESQERATKQVGQNIAHIEKSEEIIEGAVMKNMSNEIYECVCEDEGTSRNTDQVIPIISSKAASVKPDPSKRQDSDDKLIISATQSKTGPTDTDGMQISIKASKHKAGDPENEITISTEKRKSDAVKIVIKTNDASKSCECPLEVRQPPKDHDKDEEPKKDEQAVTTNDKQPEIETAKESTADNIPVVSEPECVCPSDDNIEDKCEKENKTLELGTANITDNLRVESEPEEVFASAVNITADTQNTEVKIQVESEETPEVVPEGEVEPEIEPEVIPEGEPEGEPEVIANVDLTTDDNKDEPEAGCMCSSDDDNIKDNEQPKKINAICTCSPDAAIPQTDNEPKKQTETNVESEVECICSDENITDSKLKTNEPETGCICSSDDDNIKDNTQPKKIKPICTCSSVAAIPQAESSKAKPEGTCICSDEDNVKNKPKKDKKKMKPKECVDCVCSLDKVKRKKSSKKSSSPTRSNKRTPKEPKCVCSDDNVKQAKPSKKETTHPNKKSTKEPECVCSLDDVNKAPSKKAANASQTKKHKSSDVGTVTPKPKEHKDTEHKRTSPIPSDCICCTCQKPYKNMPKAKTQYTQSKVDDTQFNTKAVQQSKSTKSGENSGMRCNCFIDVNRKNDKTPIGQSQSESSSIVSNKKIQSKQTSLNQQPMIIATCAAQTTPFQKNAKEGKSNAHKGPCIAQCSEKTMTDKRLIEDNVGDVESITSSKKSSKNSFIIEQEKVKNSSVGSDKTSKKSKISSIKEQDDAQHEDKNNEIIVASEKNSIRSSKKSSTNEKGELDKSSRKPSKEVEQESKSKPGTDNCKCTETLTDREAMELLASCKAPCKVQSIGIQVPLDSEKGDDKDKESITASEKSGSKKSSKKSSTKEQEDKDNDSIVASDKGSKKSSKKSSTKEQEDKDTDTILVSDKGSKKSSKILSIKDQEDVQNKKESILSVKSGNKEHDDLENDKENASHKSSKKSSLIEKDDVQGDKSSKKSSKKSSINDDVEKSDIAEISSDKASSQERVKPDSNLIAPKGICKSKCSVETMTKRKTEDESPCKAPCHVQTMTVQDHSKEAIDEDIITSEKPTSKKQDDAMNDDSIPALNKPDKQASKISSSKEQDDVEAIADDSIPALNKPDKQASKISSSKEQDDVEAIADDSIPALNKPDKQASKISSSKEQDDVETIADISIIAYNKPDKQASKISSSKEQDDVEAIADDSIIAYNKPYKQSEVDKDSEKKEDEKGSKKSSKKSSIIEQEYVDLNKGFSLSNKRTSIEEQVDLEDNEYSKKSNKEQEGIAKSCFGTCTAPCAVQTMTDQEKIKPVNVSDEEQDDERNKNDDKDKDSIAASKKSSIKEQINLEDDAAKEGINATESIVASQKSSKKTSIQEQINVEDAESIDASEKLSKKSSKKSSIKEQDNLEGAKDNESTVASEKQSKRSSLKEQDDVEKSSKKSSKERVEQKSKSNARKGDCNDKCLEETMEAPCKAPCSAPKMGGKASITSNGKSSAKEQDDDENIKDKESIVVSIKSSIGEQDDVEKSSAKASKEQVQQKESVVVSKQSSVREQDDVEKSSAKASKEQVQPESKSNAGKGTCNEKCLTEPSTMDRTCKAPCSVQTKQGAVDETKDKESIVASEKSSKKSSIKQNAEGNASIVSCSRKSSLKLVINEEDTVISEPPKIVRPSKDSVKPANIERPILIDDNVRTDTNDKVPTPASDNVPKGTNDNVPTDTIPKRISDNVPKGTNDNVPIGISDNVPKGTNEIVHVEKDARVENQQPRHESLSMHATLDYPAGAPGNLTIEVRKPSSEGKGLVIETNMVEVPTSRAPSVTIKSKIIENAPSETTKITSRVPSMAEEPTIIDRQIPLLTSSKQPTIIGDGSVNKSPRESAKSQTSCQSQGKSDKPSAIPVRSSSKVSNKSTQNIRSLTIMNENESKIPVRTSFRRRQAECDCNECSCNICNPAVIRAREEKQKATNTTSKKHPPDCTCVDCLTGPIVSIETQLDCDCSICDCADCTRLSADKKIKPKPNNGAPERTELNAKTQTPISKSIQSEIPTMPPIEEVPKGINKQIESGCDCGGKPAPNKISTANQSAPIQVAVDATSLASENQASCKCPDIDNPDVINSKTDSVPESGDEKKKESNSTGSDKQLDTVTPTCECSVCVCDDCTDPNANKETPGINSKQAELTSSSPVKERSGVSNQNIDQSQLTENKPASTPQTDSINKSENVAECTCPDINKLAAKSDIGNEINIQQTENEANVPQPQLTESTMKSTPQTDTENKLENEAECSCPGINESDPKSDIEKNGIEPTNPPNDIVSAGDQSDCDCAKCNCENCIMPDNSKKTEDNASKPICDCSICVCDDCTDPNANKEIPRKQGELTPINEMSEKNNKQIPETENDADEECPCPSPESQQNKTKPMPQSVNKPVNVSENQEECVCPDIEIGTAQPNLSMVTKQAVAINPTGKGCPCSKNNSLAPKEHFENDVGELQTLMHQIKCACQEAEAMQAAGPVFKKKASDFKNTLSSLEVALDIFKEKCKTKDIMIDAMKEELKLRAHSKIFDDMLNKMAHNSKIVPDFDRTDICDYLPRPPQPPLTCVCEEHHDVKPTCDCMVSSSPLEVMDIRRIGPNSVIVKWKPAASRDVRGYEVTVNGILKSRILSGIRTSTIVDAIEMKGTINITVYAISERGKCEPPASAVYIM